MNRLTIVKIGGNVIDNPESLERFLTDFAAIEGYKILIHGGGKIATKLSADLGIQTRLVEGRRVTDADSLKIVTMVYAGLINKTITAGLQGKNCNAIGLTGADGNIIKAVKRPIRKHPSTGSDLDYGFVGDLDENSVNTDSIDKLLQAGFVPVFAAITHDGSGQLFNTNADTISSVLAAAMAQRYTTSLVYCFEKKGVLENIEDEDSVIPEINYKKYNNLKQQGIISEGMIPKLDNAFDAIGKGLKEVYIGKADALPFLREQNFGTRLII